MKRGKKLMILVTVLAALVIVTLVVHSTVAKNEEAATKAAESAVTFLTVDPDTVTALGWTYNDETINLSRSNGTWTNADDKTFPVDAAKPDAMLDVLTEVTASRSFESDNADAYGLNEPAYTVTLSADTETTLIIGNASEISGDYYASIGDGNIYLVSADLANSFAYGLWDIIAMDPVPDMTVLSGIDITTASGNLSLAYLENSEYSYTDAYHWFLRQGDRYAALGNAADTLAEGLKTLSWKRCEAYNATEEDLAAYGLDTPGATVTLYYTPIADATDAEPTAADAQPAAFVLQIGSFTDDGYYARLQESPMVYLIDSELAQSILNAAADSLLPTDICLLDWDTVASFDVTLDGEPYAFTRGTKDVTNEDGTVTAKDIFLLNGKETNSDLVNDVFDTIHDMASTGASAETPGKPEIAFAFHRDTEAFSDISLAFYRLNSTDCMVGFNGETRLTAARTDVVDLIEAVNAILLQ